LTRGDPPAWKLGEVITPHGKNWSCYEIIQMSVARTESLVRARQWKNDMRFGTLYRCESPSSIHRKLARYKLDLLGVHEVRWDIGAR